MAGNDQPYDQDRQVSVRANNPTTDAQLQIIIARLNVLERSITAIRDFLEDVNRRTGGIKVNNDRINILSAQMADLLDKLAAIESRRDRVSDSSTDQLDSIREDVQRLDNQSREFATFFKGFEAEIRGTLTIHGESIAGAATVANVALEHSEDAHMRIDGMNLGTNSGSVMIETFLKESVIIGTIVALIYWRLSRLIHAHSGYHLLRGWFAIVLVGAIAACLAWALSERLTGTFLTGARLIKPGRANVVQDATAEVPSIECDPAPVKTTSQRTSASTTPRAG